MENIKINTTENFDTPEPYETERRNRIRSFLGQAAMKAMEFSVVGSVMYTGQKVFTETAFPQGEVSSLPVITATAASIVASHHFYNKKNRTETTTESQQESSHTISEK